MKYSVKTVIEGKTVYTNFRSEQAARTFALACGGLFLDRNTEFAKVLFKALND